MRIGASALRAFTLIDVVIVVTPLASVCQPPDAGVNVIGVAPPTVMTTLARAVSASLAGSVSGRGDRVGMRGPVAGVSEAIVGCVVSARIVSGAEPLLLWVSFETVAMSVAAPAVVFCGTVNVRLTAGHEPSDWRTAVVDATSVFVVVPFTVWPGG